MKKKRKKAESRSISILVLGAGSWGTALAVQLARSNKEIFLWGRNKEKIRAIKHAGANINYLPGIKLPANVKPRSDLREVADKITHTLIATPSSAFRQTLSNLAVSKITLNGIAWASKGLETGSGKMMHAICAEELGDEIPAAMLSGPTFALDVAHGLPTAISVASSNLEFAKQWAKLISSDNFRAYTNPDIIGVEIAAACKNVIAIAAGISDGLNFGANARAAIITRGLNEIIRLGSKLGAQSQTFIGLAGLGDLVLTCSDDKSRNRRLGFMLARGKNIARAQAEIAQEIEGVKSAPIISALACRHGIDLPICSAVHNILAGKISPHNAARELIRRKLKSEV